MTSAYPTIGGETAGARVLPSTTRFGCPTGYDPRVWQARVDLAACYHLCNAFDFNEGICNHLTVLVPGTNDRFLCIPYGLMWDEVTASNLLLLDGSGQVLEGEGAIDATAFFIHKHIHDAGAVCVLHTHQPHASAICCVKEFKLHMCHQNCLRFFDEIAYDPLFNGLVLDSNEGKRLAGLMGTNRVLLHRNHGIIVQGKSVAEAFDDVYYLERACQVQILAQSTGNELSIVSDAVALKFKQDCAADHGMENWANLHFAALKRKLARCPKGSIFNT
jgi:ribulose-5-phosphate 4-epimerase/fuculose-1-phosphate aldolase|tara:strand:- start:2531 stop:3355 length:825 start_codon:yes stop_codon:yes gene_type:complete